MNALLLALALASAPFSSQAPQQFQQINAFDLAPANWPNIAAIQPIGNGDFSVGECELYTDGGGGLCVGTQWGEGGGDPTAAIEICDSTPYYPDAGFGSTQTSFQCTQAAVSTFIPFHATQDIVDMGAQIALYDSTGVIPLLNVYPDSDFSSAGGRSPGVILQLNSVNSGVLKGRLAAVNGYSFVDYLGDNVIDVSGSWQHDAEATSRSYNGLAIWQDAYGSGTDATACTHIWGFPPGAGTLSPVSTIDACLDGKLNNSGWDYVDGGQPVATQANLRSYSVVSGVTTTAVVGATLAQGAFRAPSAGVPNGFLFRVNTAGLGAGTVTISLYDATTAAAKGTAVFNCTSTGDQNLAVTSPTAWAAGDAVELRIDDSACTAANGPVGIPSATVQWQ